MAPENRPPSWIHQFARHKPKPANYADKTLAAYRLGMKARGAIVGVRVLAAEDSCPACQALAGQTYLPDDAPRLPHAGCTHPGGCRCAYTPVMRDHQHLADLIRAGGGREGRPPEAGARRP
jgi:hypothetical protein